MTSEPEGKPGRRPPTIELTATEVDQRASAAQAGADPTGERASRNEGPKPDTSGAQARRSAGRFKSHAVSTVAGAIAMAALIAGLWLAGFRPPRETVAPASPAAPVVNAPGAVNDLTAKLDKIERAIQSQQIDPALANRVTAAEARTKSLGDSIAALNRRLDEIAVISQGAAKQADTAQAAAVAAKNANQATSQTAAQKSDLEALANRMDALENALKTLAESAARPASGVDDHAARLTVAAEALRASVERGAPYQAELAAAQSLGAQPIAVTLLQPFAASGVPGAAALARDLTTLMPNLQGASETTAAASSLLKRLEASAQHLVRITRVDASAGNDPSAVIDRLKVDAARADIAAALTDIRGLPERARPLAADWVKQAEARNAAIEASRQIAASALAALAKPATQ